MVVLMSMLVLIMYFVSVCYFIYLTYEAAKRRNKGSYWVRVVFTIYFIIRFVQILTEVLL